MSLTYKNYPFLAELGIHEDNLGVYRNGEWVGGGQTITSYSPSDNKPIARITMGSLKDYHECIQAMNDERIKWMKTPAPVRGEIVRKIGEALRNKKEALGALLTLEMGKIKSEGLGEV
jgi:aldehyde dehydrogenase family 7 protein A1